MAKVRERDRTQMDCFKDLMKAYQQLKEAPTLGPWGFPLGEGDGEASEGGRGEDPRVLNDKIQLLHEQLTHNYREKKSVVEELTNLRNKLARIEMEQAATKQLLKDREDELKDRDAQIETKMSEYRTLLDTYQVLQTEHEALQEQRNELQKQLDAKVNENERLITDLLHLKEHEAEKMNEMNQMLNEIMRTHQEELQRNAAEGVAAVAAKGSQPIEVARRSTHVGAVGVRSPASAKQPVDFSEILGPINMPRISVPKMAGRSVRCHTGSIEALDTNYCPHQTPQQLLLTGSVDGYLACIDARHESTLYSFPALSSRFGVSSVGLSSDNTWCLAAATDNSIQHVHLFRQRSQCTMKGHAQKILRCGYTTLNSPFKAYSASADKTIKIWNIHRSVCVKTAHAISMITCASLHPHQSDCLVTGHRDGHIIKWTLRGDDCQQVESMQAHEDELVGIEYSPDGEYIVSCAKDNSVHMSNDRMFRVMKQLGEPQGGRSGYRKPAPVMSPDSAWIVSPWGDGDELVFWNALSGQPYATRKVPSVGQVTSLTWRFGKLITAHRDGSIVFWADQAANDGDEDERPPT